MIGFRILEYGITLIEITIGIQILEQVSALPEKRYARKFITILFITALIWILNQYQLFSALTTAVCIGCFLIYGTIFCQIGWVKTLMLASGDILLIYISDFLAVSVLGILLQEEMLAVIVGQGYSMERTVFLFFSKLILILSYLFLRRYYLREARFEGWKVLPAAAAVFLVLYFCVQNSLSGLSAEGVIMWALLLVTVLMGAYLYAQHARLARQQMNLELAEQKSQMAEDQYEALSQSYQENQMFYHNLKNQHLILNRYLQEGNYAAAKAYMEELGFSNMAGEKQEWTGIRVLDFLLSCKKEEAERQGISMEIQTEPLRLALQEQDMTVLMGNALDNALEACERMSGKNRWIRLSFQQQGDMTFIKIENSCEQEPAREGKRFLTGKTDKEHHGLGLNSMRNIIEKYGGNMYTAYEAGIFTVTISLFG